MGEIYKDFPIRHQDAETRQTLDMLQGWGRPGGGIVRKLVERGSAAVRIWWRGR